MIKFLNFLCHDFKTKLKHQNLFIYTNIPSTKDQTIHIMIQVGQVNTKLELRNLTQEFRDQK